MGGIRIRKTKSRQGRLLAKMKALPDEVNL